MSTTKLQLKRSVIATNFKGVVPRLTEPWSFVSDISESINLNLRFHLWEPWHGKVFDCI